MSRWYSDLPIGEPVVSVHLSETKTILVCERHARGIRRAGQPQPPKRQHLIQSAGYWFEGSRKAQREGKSAEAVSHMENAYNHVENALAAVTAERDKLAAATQAHAAELAQLREENSELKRQIALLTDTKRLV